MTMTARRPRTTTADILTAVAHQLEQYGDSLNTHPGLKNVTIIVSFNERTGRPHRVIVRTEGQDDVEREQAPR